MISAEERSLNRVLGQAIIIGVLIGLSAMLLQIWVGEAGWLARGAALLLLGGLICWLQFWLLRRHRRG